MFGCHLLDIYCIQIKDIKRVDLEIEVGRGTVKSRGRFTKIRTYYMKKESVFQLKKEKTIILF